jgi:hypothetical protein
MKCKNGITLNLKELYSLGIIKRKKKKRRKGKTQGYTKMGEPKSDSSQMVGAGYTQPPIFQNTSNLQTENLRLRNNQLEEGEPSDVSFQNRQFKYLEDRIDTADGNHKWLSDGATKALQHLLGNGQSRFDTEEDNEPRIGFSYDDGNDVAGTAGSDSFLAAGDDVPETDEINDDDDNQFYTPAPAPRPNQSLMNRFFRTNGVVAKVAPFSSPFASPSTPPVVDPESHKRGGEAERKPPKPNIIALHRQEARELGITDDAILNSRTKKTILDAIHRQKQDLFDLRHEYSQAGGIDPDIVASKNTREIKDATRELISRKPVEVKKVRIIKPKKG